jgi:putative addiction module killer protein
VLVGKKVLKEYQTRAGKAPYLDWLHSLREGLTRAVIRNRVDRLEEGNPGNCNSVGHGVYELKIFFGPGYRVYFGEDGPALVILLCGGDKKTQQKDIKKAHAHWADYWRQRYGT